jgi:hypothetical protein
VGYHHGSLAAPPRPSLAGPLGPLRALGALALAAWVLLVGGACDSRAPGRALVLVTLGGEGRALEPLAAALGQPALEFPAAHSPANWPLAGVRALLGAVEGPPDAASAWSREALDAGVLTLAERLQAAGLRPAAVLSDGAVAQVEGLRQGFEAFDDGPAECKEDLEATRRALGAARGLLRSHSFLWIHLRGADPPYALREAGLEAAASTQPLERGLNAWLKLSRTHPEETALELLRCHAEAQAAHRAELANFLAELAAGGPQAPTVLVTSLCGYELLEDGLIGAGTTAREPGLAVPFLLLGPGIPEGSVRRRVSLADAGPTLLDLAGLEVPKGSRGLSVLPGAPAPWRLHLATVRRLRPADVLYEEDLKLLRDRETGALALYDLAADPGETQDLSKRRGSELSRLKAALDERVEAP